MSLLSRFRFWWDGTPQRIEPPEVVADVPVVEDIPPVTGGIRKVQPKQYVLGEHRHGGRIVRVMPSQLRYMKQLAEKTDDE